MRRETASGYLKAAGVGVPPPGAWGWRAPAKPANEVTTGSDAGHRAEQERAQTIRRGVVPNNSNLVFPLGPGVHKSSKARQFTVITAVPNTRVPAEGLLVLL